MLNKLSVHGFRTLIETDISFKPLTIMIGKNGVGKTSVLDVLQILGNFARGGVDRAFGGPPWSLAWQRTRGIGRVHVRIEVQLTIESQSYQYLLVLGERDQEAFVTEERLMRLPDHTILASYDTPNPPAGGSILSMQASDAHPEISAVSRVFRSVISYELNPSKIEERNDPEHSHVGRDGFGVAGYLANLQESAPERFSALEDRIRTFRPETDAIDVWSAGSSLFWGLRDQGQRRAFPAVHMSWGDRQLVGLLCVLTMTTPRSTIAIEEIDRGFHPSRYNAVIEILTEAAYKGIDGREPIQLVITTHSPSFLDKLTDRFDEVRLVTRVPSGGTVIRPLNDVLTTKLGTDRMEQGSIGDVWEMGLLEEQGHL